MTQGKSFGGTPPTVLPLRPAVSISPDDAFFIRHGTAIISNRPGAIVEFTRAGRLDSNPSGDWLSVLTPWPLGLVRRTEHCRPGRAGRPSLKARTAARP